MRVYQLIDSVQIECQVHFAYYEYERECRIEIGQKEAYLRDITGIYAEENELYIEVEKF